jgi:hypothetical protein
MSEFQKIAIGLLSTSHPEIHRSRTATTEPATAQVTTSASKPARAPMPAPAASALRGLKFAFAALLAGARSIPLGDNGRVTRELGDYGKQLNGC